MQTRSDTPIRRLFVYSMFVIGAVMLLVGVALTIWNIGHLRERRELRRILHPRLHEIAMADMLRDYSADHREHVRACYLHPDRVDFARISWNLLSQPSPFVGYAPQLGDQAEGHFNTVGLRDRREVAMPRPDDVYRIFLTGGSFAYSIGTLGPDTTIAAYLERALNERNPWSGRRVEVFNAAVPAWASTQERILIENRLSELEPDLVVSLTGANDVHWAYLKNDILWFRAYEDQMYLELINRSLRRAGAEPFRPEPAWTLDEPPSPETVARLFVKNVRLAGFALADAGAQYVVALQPTLSPHAKTLSPGERAWLEQHEPAGKGEYLAACFGAMDEALARVRDARGEGSGLAAIHAIDVRDVFDGRDDSIFIDMFHTVDKGNQLIAQRLADEIARLQLPPKP